MAECCYYLRSNNPIDPETFSEKIRRCFPWAELSRCNHDRTDKNTLVIDMGIPLDLNRIHKVKPELLEYEWNMAIATCSANGYRPNDCSRQERGQFGSIYHSCGAYVSSGSLLELEEYGLRRNGLGFICPRREINVTNSYILPLSSPIKPIITML